MKHNVLYNPYGRWEPSRKAVDTYNSLAKTELMCLDNVPRDDPALLEAYELDPSAFGNVQIEDNAPRFFLIEIDEYGRETIIENPEAQRLFLIECELNKENARLQEIIDKNPLLYNGMSDVIRRALVKFSGI